jgi:choice-of-anchor B domain-containing protein
VINEETGFAYVVGAGDGGETCGGGLHMVDIQEPEPRRSQAASRPSPAAQSTGYTHDAQCVVYRGPTRSTRAARSASARTRRRSPSPTSPTRTNPVTVAVATYPNVAYSHQGWLSEDQRYFFMNDELDETGGLVSNTRTLVWDIADLDDPILAGVLRRQRASDHNLYVVGSRCTSRTT